MKEYFSISETAKMVHMTSETLRHYDRIGLVKPSKVDGWTKYRYYTRQDIVRLNTVYALRLMDLSLEKIKTVLAYDDLDKIISFLAEAEQKVDEKIAALQYSRSKIQLAKVDFEQKRDGRERTSSVYVKHFPERVILLSDTLESPTLDVLWNYLQHFYDRIDPSVKDAFSFEDLAGVYTENGRSRLFAVCIRHGEMDGLKVLPAGNYLCADCTEEDKESVCEALIKTAGEEYGVRTAFTIQQIVVSGILQWKYQTQIYLGQ